VPLVFLGTPSLPPGYGSTRGVGLLVVARDDCLETVRGVIAEHGSLYAWAAARPGARALAGRGRAYAVEAPVSAGGPGAVGSAGSSAPNGAGAPTRWVVRHYRRGGAVRWLGDRYLRLGTVRPLRELRASAAARARGVRTPEVLALAVHRAGAWYRADLVTAEVAGATDLAEALWAEHADAVDAAARRQSLGAAAQLLDALADAGVAHADLNAKNILLAPGSPGAAATAPVAHVIDLDGCRVGGPLAPGARAAARARLVRSLRKWERRTGRPLRPEEWQVLGIAAGEESHD
jgi:3-deoxy-D-manno-octulosonic acid kinase